MNDRNEHDPGEPAPADGSYEALNVFGRPFSHIAEAKQGEPLPDLPRGFTWRRVAVAAC